MFFFIPSSSPNVITYDTHRQGIIIKIINNYSSNNIAFICILRMGIYHIWNVNLLTTLQAPSLQPKFCIVNSGFVLIMPRTHGNTKTQKNVSVCTWPNNAPHGNSQLLNTRHQQVLLFIEVRYWYLHSQGSCCGKKSIR